MSESTQDVSTLDGRLVGIDRRLREIQAELIPDRAPRDVSELSSRPEPAPRREPTPSGRTGPLASLLSRAPRSGQADRQLDRISELTAVYAELLISLREVLESQPPAEPEPGEPVTLSCGPFGTIGAVREFERRLAALPGVGDVHLRGYEGDDRAVFDVQLEGDSS